MSESKNRFSALLEDNNAINFKNNKSNDTHDNRSKSRNSFNNDNNFDNRNHNRSYENKNNYFLSKTKPIIKETQSSYDAVANENDFPDLVKEKKLESNLNQNFLSALESKEIKIVESSNKIPDGWMVTKLNCETKEIIREYGKTRYFEKKLTSIEIMEIIANKYEAWKERYIQIWGDDQYDKMYRFTNYDYNYFDKLDEKYEEEMAIYYRENSDELSYSNSDYETNDDYYENY